jgi:rhodanese-related sulfurtransferase
MEPTDRFHRLDADGLAEALAGPRAPYLLDVRDVAAFEAGHVPGARNIHVHELARRPRDLPQVKITRVLVFAEPGKRGEAAASYLHLMGYIDVALVEGGVTAYRGELERGPARPAPRQNAGPELRIVP